MDATINHTDGYTTTVTVMHAGRGVDVRFTFTVTAHSTSIHRTEWIQDGVARDARNVPQVLVARARRAAVRAVRS